MSRRDFLLQSALAGMTFGIGHARKPRPPGGNPHNNPPSWPASYFTGPLGSRNVVPASAGSAMLIDYYDKDTGLTSTQKRADVLQRISDCGRSSFDGLGIHYGDPQTPDVGVGGHMGVGSEQWAHDNGMIPVVSWSPARSSSTANLMVEINAGTHDAKITTAATYWKNLGFRVIWRCFWEFNGNWYAYSPVANASINNPGCTNAQWVSAYQRVVGIVQGVFSPSPCLVGFGWSPAENQDHAVRDACYPGDTYVDWVMPDSYNHDGGGDGTTWSCPLHGDWAEFREIWNYSALGSGQTDTYTQYAGSKPFIPGETGTKYDTAGRPAGHTVDVNRKANWYRNIDSVAKENMPNLCGVMLFDQLLTSEGNDWRVDSNQPAGTSASGSVDAVTYQGFKDFAGVSRWKSGVAGGAT